MIRPLSLPGLTPQVGLARLAALQIAELGQARVPLQSILFNEVLFSMDARVISAFTRVFRRAMPGMTDPNQFASDGLGAR
jgi:hypothetical protein